MLNAASAAERLLSVANVLQPIAGGSDRIHMRTLEALKGGYLEENL